MSTNARSLLPKIESLNELFTETNEHIALVVSETWLKEGRALENNASDLELRNTLGGNIQMHAEKHKWTQNVEQC